MKKLMQYASVVVVFGVLLAGCATSKPALAPGPSSGLETRVNNLTTDVSNLKRDKADKDYVDAGFQKDRERITDLETWQRQVTAMLEIRDAHLRGLETQGLVQKEMINLALEPGMTLVGAEIYPFPLGKVDLAGVFTENPGAKEVLDNIKGLLRDKGAKAKVLASVGFEDTNPCPEEKCPHVVYHRACNVAKYLGLRCNVVDVRAPTQDWGQDEDNRRVVVFYKMSATYRR